jgi:hypothetical protein
VIDGSTNKVIDDETDVVTDIISAGDRPVGVR